MKFMQYLYKFVKRILINFLFHSFVHLISLFPSSSFYILRDFLLFSSAACWHTSLWLWNLDRLYLVIDLRSRVFRK